MEPTKEIESKILAVIRVRESWHKYRGVLQLSFFGSEATRQIFTVIEGFFKKYDLKKLTTGNMKIILQRAIKDKDLLEACLDIVRKIRKLSYEDTKVVEEIIKDFSKRQLIKLAITEGIALLETPDPDFSTLKDHIDRALNVSTEGETDAYHYFSDPSTRVQEEKDEKKISTGISKLDELFRGGMSPGELLVFLGPPGRGKTLALINMGVGALQQGLFVFHATLEISARKVARRYDSRISSLDFEDLLKSPHKVKPSLEAIKKRGGELIIRDYSMESPRVADLYGSILKHEQRVKRKVDAVVVDYGDLFRSAQHFKDPRFGLEEIYTDLRRMGSKLGVPVYTASQTTRKSLSKNIIDMEDVAESFGKVKVADVILGICQTPEEEEDNLVRLFVAKSRKQQGHQSVRLAMEPSRMYLGELETPGEVKRKAGGKSSYEKGY